MCELAKALMKAGIDNIKDDQEFVEEENNFIRDYCIERNFDILLEDKDEISNRGMDDAFEFWKNEFKNGR